MGAGGAFGSQRPGAAFPGLTRKTRACPIKTPGQSRWLDAQWFLRVAGARCLPKFLILKTGESCAGPLRSKGSAILLRPFILHFHADWPGRGDAARKNARAPGSDLSPPAGQSVSADRLTGQTECLTGQTDEGVRNPVTATSINTTRQATRTLWPRDCNTTSEQHAPGKGASGNNHGDRKIIMRKHHGFTMAELLIVTAIVGVTAAVATPSVISSVRGYRMRSAGQQIIQALQTAKFQAIRTNSRAQVRFSETNKTIQVVNLSATGVVVAGPAIPLPPGVEFKLATDTVTAPADITNAASQVLPGQQTNDKQAVSFPASGTYRVATFTSRGVPGNTDGSIMEPGVVNWIYLGNAHGETQAVTMSSGGSFRIYKRRENDASGWKQAGSTSTPSPSPTCTNSGSGNCNGTQTGRNY
ncbi:MAG: Tfp pilus assembly protein FimT/FimU [Blastocatellia bacterium]